MCDALNLMAQMGDHTSIMCSSEKLHERLCRGPVLSYTMPRRHKAKRAIKSEQKGNPMST